MSSPLSALFAPFDIEGKAVAFIILQTCTKGARAIGTGIIGPKQMWERACPNASQLRLPGLLCSPSPASQL
ncbi:hypothetical protein ACI2KG_25860, partial [Pseudomonas sp. NPDC089407]|uniref:hypothetical protein n=1 Tax=Pseudomonas sp. NPDC089407 TaxID=3364464 RepID=UPI00384A9789